MSGSNKKALVGNAADPKQVKKARNDEKFANDERLNDVSVVMSTKEGRRYMCNLLKSCKIYVTSFTGNSHTFFNEGMRNVGLKVLADIQESSLDQYNLMLKESSDKGEML